MNSKLRFAVGDQVLVHVNGWHEAVINHLWSEEKEIGLVPYLMQLSSTNEYMYALYDEDYVVLFSLNLVCRGCCSQLNAAMNGRLCNLTSPVME